MTDKTYLTFLKKLADSKEDFDHGAINEEIVSLFPKELLAGRKKGTKILLKILVKNYFEVLKEEKIEEALKLLNTIYQKLYPNTATRDTELTKDIRRPIAKEHGNKGKWHKMSLEIAKLSGSEKDALVNKQAASLHEKHEELKRYDPVKINKIISDAISIGDEDPYRLAVGLALACGSRPIELLQQANYELVEGKKDWIFQDFVAKKRGKKIGVTKPLIGMTAEKFIDLIGDMRYAIKALYRVIVDPKGELNKALNAKLNEKTKALFDYQPNITFYSCRGIYGDYSYNLFAKNSIYGKDPTIQLWLENVLKHAEGDIVTGNHYSIYKSEQKEVTYPMISELISKVNDLEERLAEKGAPPAKACITNLKAVKQQARFKEVEEVFNANKNVGQTKLEELLKGKVPRATVRLYYQLKKLEKA